VPARSRTSGEPELISTPWPLPTQALNSQGTRSIKIHSQSPRPCYPWTPIRIRYFLETTLGTNLADPLR